eukprot:TRINITY_DN32292_c0_g1_i1.p1 TRINITY_DN32292_c0_g1~~TRINITY_DN32292_c0_g1_i1.p1  ORF type:complete len:672 (+),score=100.14 TRINITY_DN32292_c0_g1_i1:45-2060(+)
MTKQEHLRISRLSAQLLPLPVAGPNDELVPAAADIEISDADMRRLRERYALERDKRLDARPEGSQQYMRIADLAEHDDRFKRMLEDPYPGCGHGLPAPLTDEVEICIVGAGYGGLCAGARLVTEGISPKDIRLLDKGRDVGGTWYWNRYPGAMCDIEAYIYMPLCEELGYVPTMKYAEQPEILAHSQLIAKTYGLYNNACFGAAVTELRWHETFGMWVVKTSRGDSFRARYVIMNFGTFTQPKLPGVPGIESFQGHVFHTSRFDYAYTGGSSKGGLDRLGDKRVGIVGTGATAVQVVPHLGASAKQVYVFQRTPSSVDIRNNRETSELFANEFLSKPGWQRERNGNFYDMTQTLGGARQDLVNDGWTDIIRNLGMKSAMLYRQRVEEAQKTGVAPDKTAIGKEVARVNRMVQYQQMEKVRRRVEVVVKDRGTADGLKPWYDQFCKRPCFHDEYLSAFNRPNVKLVHTDGLGIEGFTPKGVVARGIEYEIDCLVLATGFEASFGTTDLGPRKLGYEIYGVGGLSLSEKWGDEKHRYGAGPKTYRSYHSAGFPNLCMQNAPQGAFTTNFVYQLDEAAKHFAHIIANVKARGYKTFDVRVEEEEKYLDLMWKESPVSNGKRGTCTPGYYNDEGKVEPAGTRRLAGMYPGGARKLFQRCELEREEGKALDCFNLV